MSKMKNPRTIFHLISYLQYPLMLAAVAFYVPFILSLKSGALDWTYLNYALIIFGIALSFSTLQDTTKTQNKLSRKIWESPTKGKITIVVMALFAFSMIIGGLSMLYFSQTGITESVAVGLIVLGIGLIGLLKSAIEMFENHRKDKNTTINKGEILGINVPLPINKES